jgi:Nucleotidyl transferase AbiEii toxin, Type IV TA system
MLQKKAIERGTLDLIINLQKQDYLKDFYLVGGTGLALIYDHRKSIDIDLFCNKDFDTYRIIDRLSSDFNFTLLFSEKNTIRGSINSVSVDLIAHKYPYIQPQLQVGGISMLSIADIAAMKLNAIASSGQRIKDFVDIYYLLKEYSFSDLILFYTQKYNQHNPVNLLKGLVYFDDVDIAEWPVLLRDDNLSWSNIKNLITLETLKYSKQKFI